MEEKRKTSRVEKAIVMKFARNTDGQLCWDSTTIKNICCEGLLFNSSKLFAKDEILKLSFCLPNDPFTPLQVEGQVIESIVQGHSARIKFVNLSDQNKQVISDYVNFLLKSGKKI